MLFKFEKFLEYYSNLITFLRFNVNYNGLLVNQFGYIIKCYAQFSIALKY